jgi:hypothetical protein
MTEGLASPTLAQLYLAQGHPGRARTTLDEVLADDPHNGMALALRERLRLHPHAEVHARFEPGSGFGGEIELSWSVPERFPWPAAEFEPRLELIFAIARLRDGSALRFSSRICPGPRGTERIGAPLGPASAALALVAHQRGGGLRFLAVAEPLSW